MINKLCHFEVGVRDYPAAKKFYSKVFDWKFEATKDGREMIRTGDDVGGHLASMGHKPQNYVVFYIMVDDVEATVKKAVSLGGKAVLGPLEDGRGNTYAWIADPEGNVVGIYSEKKKK